MSASLNRQQKLMQAARSSASFDPLDLTYIIYNGHVSIQFCAVASYTYIEMNRKEDFENRALVRTRIEDRLGESNPLRLPKVYEGLDRKAQYHNGLRFAQALLEDELKHGHGYFDRTTHHYTLINASPFGLHPLMFIPSLELQASPEQLAYWMPLAKSGKIIGAYCQTELGHGTFLRGLETTATFDRENDNFIIVSPTITSTKYWPGGIGYSTTHAIVMARLILNNTDYGVHPFMVQLRSLEDFRPMPGIELGDIGSTMGLNSTDNGYAVFNQVRIPRTHMLMGNSSVSKDGAYTTKAANNKLSYSTMIYTRNVIAHTVAFQLAQASTIAIRYSVVREQGNLHFNSQISQETSIMHVLQVPALPASYGIISSLCNPFRFENIALAYGHITTSALKAWSTQVASDGAEDARKCCGGHGYSVLSGLPDLSVDLAAMTTLEGENYVMFQQAARYLVKCVTAISAGQPIDRPMEYLSTQLSEKCAARGEEFLNPEVQLSIFRHRAVRLAFDCHKLLEDSKRDGNSSDAAWNKHMMSLLAAARAHIEYFVLQSFIDQVARIRDTSLHAVVKRLCDLFALSTIESPFSIGALGFFEDSYIVGTQLRDIRAHVHDSLTRLLPEVIGLTDAWGFSDASLQSALGQKDGNVYEILMSWTRQLSFNKACQKSGGVDIEGFEKYIEPILRAKL
ncbi:hypothetical protein H0H92_015122 [Tricholoma furcatifolium]|nr:hypothetical protein H0H92_015122 [Tricholoma furcatifolium]